MLRVFIHDINPSVILSWHGALRKFEIIEQIHFALHPSEAFVRIRKMQIDLIFWGVSRRAGREHELFEQMMIDKPLRPVVVMVDLVKPDLIQKMMQEGARAVTPRTNSEAAMALLLLGVLGGIAELDPPHPILHQPEFTYHQLEFYRDLAWGYENDELSKRHEIAYETVRTHIKNLGRQMKTTGREQLVAAGFRNNVLH